MTKIYNKTSVKKKRKNLRRHMTEEEVILWSFLKDGKFKYKFRRQYSIGEYIADFFCVEKRLVIELDGSQHIDNKEYDLLRERYFSSLGITTLRFWNNEVRKNLSGVIQKILSNLQ